MDNSSRPASAGVEETVSATFPLALAVWLALIAGILELAYRMVVYSWFGQPFRAGLDAVWMVPLSNLIWFGSAGLALSLAVWRWPHRVSPQIVLTVLALILFAGLAWLNGKIHKKAATILALGIAVQVGRMGAARFVAIDRRVRRTAMWPIAVMVLAFLAVIGGRRGVERWRMNALPERSQASTGQTSVLLLILDTVRAFNMSMYGYAKPTTPNLELWAQQGVRFDRAFVTAPWTFPSHVAMFTGRYPYEMPMASTKDVGWKYRLSKQTTTLAEVLRSNGYATGGFVGNLSYTSWEFGLNRGFIHYEDHRVTPRTFFASSIIGRRLTDYPRVKRFIGAASGIHRRPGEEITQRILTWLDKVDNRPFFVFANLFDAHGPLDPPAPFDTLFGPRNPTAIIGSDLEFGENPGTSRNRMSSYDGAIAYLDQQVDFLLKEMQQRGLLENTLVIVTSDHGEHWGDHNRFSHTSTVYRQLLQVPLVFWHGSRFPAATVVTEPVSLRDLPATILDIVGIENRGRMLGVSLTGQIRAHGAAQMSEPPVASPVLSLSEAKDVTDFVSIIARGKHYIRHSGKEELYDLDSDPLDTLNLVATPMSQAALPAFRATLDSIRRADVRRIATAPIQ